jgi:hypothetical protein
LVRIFCRSCPDWVVILCIRCPRWKRSATSAHQAFVQYYYFVVSGADYGLDS